MTIIHLRTYHTVMARLAPRVPELNDVLCEACGYVLNGLPAESRCPECGKPIAESIGKDRLVPNWEDSGATTDRFLKTTIELIFQPKHFYQTFAVRGSLDAARRFARVHWWIASALFAISAATHTFWYWFLLSPGPWLTNPVTAALFGGTILGLTVAAYFALDGITRLAARLTNWEATYRGLRLPYGVVLRGMYYHAAHYLPVALAAAVVVGGYQILLLTHIVSATTSDRYLYILCGLVIISAVYLFNTYWIGMRNMMYANR